MTRLKAAIQTAAVTDTKGFIPLALIAGPRKLMVVAFRLE